MQKNNLKKCFSKVLFPLSTHKTQFMLMDYLVLLSYLSPQLFFKIKPFAGLSCLADLQCIIIIIFCLSTDPKIKNMASYKYTLYKTAKSQTVDHFYQHRQLKLLNV